LGQSLVLSSTSEQLIWKSYTKDKKLSAQWEHTLLVTETGVEILTLRPEETIERLINHD